MPAAKPTEAAIARAIRAARREGCGVVSVRNGEIRILVNEAPEPLASPEPEGDNPWDSTLKTGT